MQGITVKIRRHLSSGGNLKRTGEDIEQGRTDTIIKQMWGIILLEYRYHGNLPDIEYCPAVQYSLPFEGEWVVINGGVTKETSHSWEIPTQRYAYDF